MVGAWSYTLDKKLDLGSFNQDLQNLKLIIQYQKREVEIIPLLMDKTPVELVTGKREVKHLRSTEIGNSLTNYLMMEQREVFKNLVKVGFKLPKSDWHPHTVEWVWAESLGNNLYRLRNTPFYAYGYSFLDVVKGIQENNAIYVHKSHKPSQHSTYRIAFYNKDIPEKDYLKYMEELLELGCTYESYNILFAIDVPPEVDIEKVYKILSENEKKEIWGFQEAHYAHPHKNPRLSYS